jgi:hypothetical protein
MKRDRAGRSSSRSRRCLVPCGGGRGPGLFALCSDYSWVVSNQEWPSADSLAGQTASCLSTYQASFSRTSQDHRREPSPVQNHMPAQRDSCFGPRPLGDPSNYTYPERESLRLTNAPPGTFEAARCCGFTLSSASNWEPWYTVVAKIRVHGPTSRGAKRKVLFLFPAVKASQD